MEVNILVIEDDVDINGLLCNILKRRNYEVRGAYSGTEGLMCIDQFKYDIILVDLMLPGVTGEEIIAEIRKKNELLPIIVISAKSEQETKIKVLELGADDFVSKPFDINEVVARVQRQIKRYRSFNSGNSKEQSDEKTFKNIVVKTESRQVFVNEKELVLTAREYDILLLFLNNPKKVLSRANIFNSVWNTEFLGDDNTINVHVSNIRNKIAKYDREIEYIKTVWGIGFKLNNN